MSCCSLRQTSRRDTVQSCLQETAGMISVTVRAAGRDFCQTISTSAAVCYYSFIYLFIFKLDWTVIKAESESTNCFSSTRYTRVLVKGLAHEEKYILQVLDSGGTFRTGNISEGAIWTCDRRPCEIPSTGTLAFTESVNVAPLWHHGIVQI